MRRRTKLLIKRWIERLLLLVVVAILVGVNVAKLKNNSYANNEKIVDYGRISEEEPPVEPIIATVFYAGKNENKGVVSSYYNHSANYKRKNVRMVVVPKKVTTYSAEVIEHLYGEISENNKFEKILLVYDMQNAGDVEPHEIMLQEQMGCNQVKQLALSVQNLDGEKIITDYLRNNRLVVFLADLAKGLNKESGDFLTGEAVYFAQKNFYNMNVFDVIDTQLAKAIDKDYETLYPLQTIKNESGLQKQKRNLENYKRNYGQMVQKYLDLNLKFLQEGKGMVLPPKSEENYRLYDRGRMVLKAFNADYIEIFEAVALEENKGVSALLADLAHKLIKSGLAKQAKYFKLYLLTDMEKVEPIEGVLLAAVLEEDDGILAEYKGKKAVLVADDKPDFANELVDVVKNKAEIAIDTAQKDIEFFKFKTVEINYGY